MRNEAEIRLVVERMTAHIVRALSATPLDIAAYRAAFRLPGVELQSGEGADRIVIANLLANCADGVCLFPPDSLPPLSLGPAAAEHRAAVVAAAASGDRTRLLASLSNLLPVTNLDEQLSSEVIYALSSDYTHVTWLCGGLPAVQDITGIIAGVAASPAEGNIVHAASLIVSALCADQPPCAAYAIDTISRRSGGASTLARMLGLLVRAAWVTIGKASPATRLSDTSDERLRVAGLAPRGDSARRAIRLVRKAIISLSTDEPAAEVVRHATALANIPEHDLPVAVRFAASTIARHVPAAVRAMVDQAFARLDPDQHPYGRH